MKITIKWPFHEYCFTCSNVSQPSNKQIEVYFGMAKSPVKGSIGYIARLIQPKNINVGEIWFDFSPKFLDSRFSKQTWYSRRIPYGYGSVFKEKIAKEQKSPGKKQHPKIQPSHQRISLMTSKNPPKAVSIWGKIAEVLRFCVGFFFRISLMRVDGFPWWFALAIGV